MNWVCVLNTCSSPFYVHFMGNCDFILRDLWYTPFFGQTHVQHFELRVLDILFDSTCDLLRVVQEPRSPIGKCKEEQLRLVRDIMP